MQIAREPGETDEQLRKRVENHHKRRCLRDLLSKLDIKSADGGLDPAFNWKSYIQVPGVYSNVKVETLDDAS